MNSIATHYRCIKGNDHWLSHVTDWEGDQYYHDDCYVNIKIENGEIIHLTVFPDLTREEALEKGWYTR